WRSRHSNRRTPSSRVSRRPSMAFDKMSRTVVLKAHSLAGEAKLARQHVEVVQARLFPRPQVKMNNVGQIAAAESRVAAQTRSFAVGDRANVSDAVFLRAPQRIGHAVEFDAGPHRPERVHER